MLINKGEKILISHRRLFENDAIRYFIGEVEFYEQGLVRVRGYTWAHTLNGFERKPDYRTKIFSLNSGSLISYVLPSRTEIEKIKMVFDEDNSHWLREGSHLNMNLTERCSNLNHTLN